MRCLVVMLFVKKGLATFKMYDTTTKPWRGERILFSGGKCIGLY